MSPGNGSRSGAARLHPPTGYGGPLTHHPAPTAAHRLAPVRGRQVEGHDPSALEVVVHHAWWARPRGVLLVSAGR